MADRPAVPVFYVIARDSVGRWKRIGYWLEQLQALAAARDVSAEGWAPQVDVVKGLWGSGALYEGEPPLYTLRHGSRLTVKEEFDRDQARGADFTPGPADDLGEEL